MYIIIDAHRDTPVTMGNGESLRFFATNREAEQFIKDQKLNPGWFGIYELTERPHNRF